MDRKKVNKIIADQLCVYDSDVVESANLQHDLAADSLDTIELVMHLEEEFDITIPDEDVEGIKTVGDLYSYLEGRVK